MQAMNRRTFVATGALATMATGASLAVQQAYAADGVESDQNPAWLGPEPQIAENQISKVVDTEVVVVGSGTAGIFAACAAAEEGAKTVLMEQFSEGYGHGVRKDVGVYNSRVQQNTEGWTFDLEEFIRYAQSCAGYCNNQQLLKMWIEESGEACDWWEDRANEAGYTVEVQLALPKEGERPAWSTSHEIKFDEHYTAYDGNDKCLDFLEPYAQSKGVECLFDTKLVKCVKEGDRVTGVIGELEDGTYVQVNASKGVVLCCGGYLENPEMFQALQPEMAVTVPVLGPLPGTKGEGIKAALWAGGVLDPIQVVSGWEEGIIYPDKYCTDEDCSAGMYCLHQGALPFLRVNMNGERFMNESDGGFDAMEHALVYQPHMTAACIWDSSWEEDSEKFNVYGAQRNFPWDNGFPARDNIDWCNEELQEQIELGLVVQADTIEELAEKLGLPVETFVATVERYNELADKGEDPDFGKPGYRLSRIDEAPYYGARFGGFADCTMNGVIVDANLQVLDAERLPIPGLYAAGSNAGGSFGVLYPGAQAAGIEAGRAVVTGRHVGKHLASL